MADEIGPSQKELSNHSSDINSDIASGKSTRSRSHSRKSSLKISRSWMLDQSVMTPSAALQGISSPSREASAITFTEDQIALRALWKDLISLQNDILNVEDLLIMTKSPPYVMVYLSAVKLAFKQIKEELLKRFVEGSAGNMRAAVDELQQTVKNLAHGNHSSDQTEMMSDALNALEEYIASLYS